MDFFSLFDLLHVWFFQWSGLGWVLSELLVDEEVVEFSDGFVFFIDLFVAGSFWLFRYLQKRAVSEVCFFGVELGCEL